MPAALRAASRRTAVRFAAARWLVGGCGFMKMCWPVVLRFVGDIPQVDGGVNGLSRHKVGFIVAAFGPLFDFIPRSH